MLVVAAASEIVLRIVYHPENLGTVFCFDETLGWSLKPNATYRSVDFRREHEWWIHTNALGLREREIDVAKPGGKRRILVLGDSMVFGSGVDQNWRFTDFLQRALGDDVEVINAGIAGYGNDQELLLFETRLADLEPDIVVLTLTMANDVLNNMLDHLFLKTSPKPRFVASGDSLRLIPIPPQRPVSTSPLRRLLRRSRLLVFAKRRLDRIAQGRIQRESVTPIGRRFGQEGLEQNYSNWSVYRKTYDPEFEEAWRVTESLVLRLAGRCEAAGARLFVFALPLRIEVNDAWRTDLAERAGIDTSLIDVAAPYRRLLPFLERNDIPYVYPFETFRDALARQELYFHHGHLNRHGNAVAAGCVLPALSLRYGIPYHFAASDLEYLQL